MTIVATPYNMVICGHSSDDKSRHYRGRIEKVKFGVPVAEAFSHDIPATLLVLLLKVNKEGPLKKDIWRAPGNQAHVRKLIQVMQHGRLVNIANFSVYTAASVIKKFLVKLPGGIFGFGNEERLFGLLDIDEGEKRREAFCRVVCSLPVPSQHLLVLLFGTFRLIADAAHTCGTRMSPEAIGVSVAPSLFLTCIHDGHRAKLEDVVRYRQASQVVGWIIGSFGCTNLFPRDAYEFYARITGRTLRVDENWTFTFQLPSSDLYLQRQWLKKEAEQMGYNLTGAFSEPEVGTDRSRGDPDCRLGCDPNPEGNPHSMPRTYCGRLGGSVGEVLTYSPYTYDDRYEDPPTGSMEQLKCANRLAESTKSLSFLGWVHERQTRRMQSRSEWFLSPILPNKICSHQRNNCGQVVNNSSQSIDTALHQRGFGVERKRSWRGHYVRLRDRDGQPPPNLEISADAMDPYNCDDSNVWVQFAAEPPPTALPNLSILDASKPNPVVYHF